ncbi:MAG: FIST N-terminal domain-containing protein [Elainellaceae cyanobacterium]
MRWTSALSTRASLEAAVDDVVEQAQGSLSADPDLGFVFISSAFASEYPRLMPLLAERLSVPTIIGSSGGGIIGTAGQAESQEIEGNVALSLALAELPDVTVTPFRIVSTKLPDLDGPPERWIDLVGVSPEVRPCFVLLADPISGMMNDLLQGLDYAYPNATKVGGLASTGAGGQQGALFYQGAALQGGAIGVALTGNIALDAIVAQGCRPIGPIYQVVEGDRNVILKVQETSSDAEPEPPLKALQALADDLTPEERELAQQALFIGVAQSEFKQVLEQGDFLIRNLMGVDPRGGALAIGDRVRPGMRIQFHLRDAKTSADDLEALLHQYHQTQQIDDGSPEALQTLMRQYGQKQNGPSSAGALLFSCLGRGENLYRKPNFDSQMFNHYVQGTPLSGFFCNGEIGPVGQTTFVHGYTSVFGILRQPD